MSAAPTRHDWELLGLEEGADRAAVDRAYRAAKACFAPDSLATYGLFEGDEDRELEARLDRAYERITGELPPPPEPERPTAGPAAAAALPDRDRSPGRHLAAAREQRGLSREEIARETKIRAWLLEQLENESFDKLPAPVYVRGFVLQIAALLRLDDPEGLARSFLDAMRRT